MAVFNLVSRATLRSPRVLASMARAALPVPATVRQPVLSLSALPALVLNVHENQSKSSLLPLVAAAGVSVFGMLSQLYEPSYCAGKRKKNGSDQVDDMYEVDHIKARKLEKGVPKYLVHWKGYTDKDDTWEASGISPASSRTSPPLRSRRRKPTRIFRRRWRRRGRKS